jgi:hypothetical protein
MAKHSDNLPLGILNGHNCLVAGTYKVKYVDDEAGSSISSLTREY